MQIHNVKSIGNPKLWWITEACGAIGDSESLTKIISFLWRMINNKINKHIYENIKF